MLGPLVYGLCAVTAGLCAVLLLRAYAQSGYRLLLWSGLCFAGLTVNNLLLVLDKVVFPSVDLSVSRSLAALCAMLLLIYGLIFDER
jgi:hydrogenase/urease accessory protein HupE